MVLTCCHPLKLFPIAQFFSYPSGAFHELFSLPDHPKAIISEDFFVLSFQLSFSNSSGASFKYPLISSRSLRSHVSISPQVSAFEILPGELCLCYFHFQFLRWFVQDFSSPVTISIHSLFPNPTGVSMKTFTSLRNIYLNPFYKNK